jgi:hypothetical protein
MKRHGLSVAEISRYTGKHFTTIHDALKLLKLAPEVRELIRNGKLRRGKVEHLHQYRDLALQIRFAQQIIRGEHPPELEELRSRTMSKERENRIVGHMPKDAAGLIRRLLEFRRRGHSAVLAVRALLGLPEAEQVKGWEQFTAATRENFEAQMREFEEAVHDVNLWLVKLPKTKREQLSGAAAVAHTSRMEAKRPGPPAPPSAARLPVAPKKVESNKALITPLADRIRAAESVSRPKQSIVHGVSPRCLEEATVEDLMVGRQFLEFLRSRNSGDFLSRSAISEALGNGHTPHEAEVTILRGLRCVAFAWRSPMPREEGLAKFVRFVALFRHETGDEGFQQFLGKLRMHDSSKDPINVANI